MRGDFSVGCVLSPGYWPDLGGIFHTEEMPCNGEFALKTPTGSHYTSYMQTLHQLRNWLLAELRIRL